MKQLMERAAMFAAMVCSVASAQAVEVAAPIPFRAMAKVWIDETGQPSKVEATSGLPLAVRTSIEEQVATWRFQSPVVDGVARGGITYVSLGACAVPEPDGSLRLALGYKGNGPGYVDDAVRLQPPRFPIEMAQKRLSGEWKVDYIVEPDGRTTFVGIAESKPRQPNVKIVEPTLRAWVKSLRFMPEQIAGAPVRTRLSTPISFLTGSSSEKADMAERKRELENSQECSAVSDADAGDRPVAVDSPFRRVHAG